MLKIFSKINPVAKAVGIIGVVAGLVSAVTFAAATSNTVALTPNTLNTANAALTIGAGNSCPVATTSTPGLSGTLVPGGPAVTQAFCLDNTGDVPLNITASIPDNLAGNTAADNTTLTITCENIGDVSGQLSSFGTPSFDSPLGNAVDPVNCTASATLSADFTGNNASIPAFSINFQGTQPTT